MSVYCWRWWGSDVNCGGGRYILVEVVGVYTFGWLVCTIASR